MRRCREATIAEETGIHIATLYAWRKGWRLEEVLLASQKDPEGWSAADKFTVVLEGGTYQQRCPLGGLGSFHSGGC